MPDELNQVSGSIGGPIVKDKTFFFATRRLHAAGSDDVPLARRCRRSCCRPDGSLDYVGHYRQTLFNGRLDHKLTPSQTLMVRVQRRSLLRHQPERRRRRHQRAERRAPVHARLADRCRSITRRCSARTCSTRRGSPTCTAIRSRSGRRRSSRPPTRAPARCRSRSASRARPTSSATRCSSPTRCRGRAAAHNLRFGGSVIHHTHRRHRQRARAGDARHVHVPEHDDRAVRSADAGRRAAVHAADQLRHHQLRAEAVDVGGVRAGQHPRERPAHARRRASLRPADADRRDERTSRRASASAGIPNGDSRTGRFAAATGCTTRRFAPTRSPAR